LATFVLVHGAWHGAWCWQNLIPALEQLGHRAAVTELPGHGEDPTPPEDVTLADYVGAVIHSVRSAGSLPVLVGHSMAGVFCAQVAEEIPDGIAALVSLASPPARDSVTMMHAVSAADPAYVGHLQWSFDARTARMSPQGTRDFLYQLCPQHLIDLALERFCPEPVAPFQVPIRITADNYGRVRRFYIGCEYDRVVTKEVQQQACRAIPRANVYTIAADHAPFFSAPEALVRCLDTIARNL
jgi:pimeloyl-ACP methyl ester carboxylesterase